MTALIILLAGSITRCCCHSRAQKSKNPINISITFPSLCCMSRVISNQQLKLISWEMCVELILMTWAASGNGICIKYDFLRKNYEDKAAAVIWILNLFILQFFFRSNKKCKHSINNWQLKEWLHSLVERGFNNAIYRTLIISNELTWRQP